MNLIKIERLNNHRQELAKQYFQEFNNIVLFGVNGRSTIMELAKAAGLDFFHVYDYIEKFVQKGLVKKLDVEWS